MENKKEPLMSAEEFFNKSNFISPIHRINFEFCKKYAKYVLNNAKEFVADGAKTTYKKEPFIGGVWDIDKQSIHTAIDNYIEINLNKEL